jgi:hypothetical protein
MNHDAERTGPGERLWCLKLTARVEEPRAEVAAAGRRDRAARPRPACAAAGCGRPNGLRVRLAPSSCTAPAAARGGASTTRSSPLIAAPSSSTRLADGRSDELPPGSLAPWPSAARRRPHRGAEPCSQWRGLYPGVGPDTVRRLLPSRRAPDEMMGHTALGGRRGGAHDMRLCAGSRAPLLGRLSPRRAAIAPRALIEAH